MKNIYPSYYKKFRCIADKCPDSCCKGWDVVVDDEAHEYYSSVSGSFGEKLKKLTEIDGDGDRIFTSQNGRCPFWNSAGLCDIYTKLGEKHLCRTCKSFPRITQDYTVFSERLLSLACPEAARLMLSEDCAYENFKEYGDDFSECDYSGDFMKFLLASREELSKIFTDRSVIFSKRLQKALMYAKELQNAVDSEAYEPISAEKIVLPVTFRKKSPLFIFSLHNGLDIMSNEWHEILCRAEKHAENKVSQKYDVLFERMSQYFIYRYFLTSIDSFDLISAVKRIFCAYAVIGAALCEECGAPEKLFWLYSKEVEHSYENSEALEFEFMTDPRFQTDNLCAMLTPCEN